MKPSEYIRPEDVAALETLKKIPVLLSVVKAFMDLGVKQLIRGLNLYSKIWIIFNLVKCFYYRVLVLAILFCFPITGISQVQKWDSLTNLAIIHHQQKEFEKSNECYEQVIAMVKPIDEDGRLTNKIKGMIALNYIYLGVPLFKAKKYTESKKLFEMALQYAANDPKVLPMANSWMGDWYSSHALQIRIAESNLQQAIEYSLLAEKYYTIANAPEKCLKEQISRATVLADISRIEDARHLFQQVIQECEGKIKRTNLLAKALNGLGAIEQNSDNYQMAIQYLERSYNLSLSSDKQNARLAANRMQRLYESQIPDKTKAELWKRRTDELLYTKERVIAFENDVKAYGDAILKIVKQDDCNGGIADLTTLINRCEKEKGYSLTMLSSFYKGRGHGYLKKKDYSLSASDCKKAISLLQKAGDEGKSDLSTTWYQLSLAYYYWGKPAEAMNAADKCVESAESYYGSYHSNTLDAYSLRSNYEGFYGIKTDAMKDRKKCVEIIKQLVIENFIKLTESERVAYWEKYLPETTIFFAFAHKLGEKESEFTDDLYNQQLLAKSLLLTVENEIKWKIKDDEELSKKYKEIEALKKCGKDTDKIIENQERSLFNQADSKYHFMNFLETTVNDIRNKLNKNEAALEFVDYRVGKDSIMYAALLLTSQKDHVLFLPLVEQKQLLAHSGNLINDIWNPILKHLPNENTIYFAPSGLLYQIPIESHLLTNGIPIGQQIHLYRMTSTRNIVINNNNTIGLNATIYGGIKYDIDVEEMKKETRVSNTRGGNFNVQLRETMDVIPYLEGTKIEAENVARIINSLTDGNISADIFMSSDGTEGSFKKLDEKSKRIIHIATHGFYQQDGSEKQYNNTLLRSGLLFAGANNAFRGIQIPSNVEDGILTAFEISLLDLRGLDIAVLSACQTGQGAVTSDGVFGLQRGFKKAGANSLLMSLWKVDDEATCVLMTEFYKNWMNGKSKYESLEIAKEKVRSTDGWRDPKYWAAFILLDGLN